MHTEHSQASSGHLGEMSAQQLYLKSKGYSQKFLDWLTRTAQGSGKISIASIQHMAQCIRDSQNYVPAEVFIHLQEAINGKKILHGMYLELLQPHLSQQALSGSDKTHKVFIQTLEECFAVLGGEEWQVHQAEGWSGAHILRQQPHDSQQSLDRTAGIMMGSKPLDPDTSSKADLSPRHEDPQPAKPNKRTRTLGRRGRGKGRKGAQRPNKTKREQQPEPESSKSIILQLMDEDTCEYHLAAIILLQKLMQLRSNLLSTWLDVQQCQLNAAVAGAVAQVAIATIKQSELAVFVDFPDSDSFYCIVDSVSRAGLFQQGLDSDNNTPKTDLREWFMCNTFQDIITFVSDFRKNRNGRPTKAMAARCKSWDSKLDLSSATHQQRLAWRSRYTIMLLYDLVSSASSLSGRLFNVEGFTNQITALVMEKEGSEIGKKLLPHHVFTLQVYVDSQMVSRGWLSPYRIDSVLFTPPLDFHPPQDVISFFSSQATDSGSQGILTAYKTFRQQLLGPLYICGDNDMRQTCDLVAAHAMYYVERILGDAALVDEDAAVTLAPLFGYHDQEHDLRSFCPLLYGIGLLDCLDVAYRTAMAMWDMFLPEPTLIVHLHNMLAQLEYLAEPLEALHHIQSTMAHCMFYQGEVPTANFYSALDAHLNGRKRDDRSRPKRGNKQFHDIHELLELYHGRFLSTTRLSVYRRANWDLARLAGDDPDNLLVLEKLGGGKEAASCPDADILEEVRKEVIADVCGEDSPLRVNFFALTGQIFEALAMAESELRGDNRPFFVDIFQNTSARKNKRMTLILGVMQETDPKALDVYARALKASIAPLESLTYWGAIKP